MGGGALAAPRLVVARRMASEAATMGFMNDSGAYLILARIST
jgi:hypothetical protein